MSAQLIADFDHLMRLVVRAFYDEEAVVVVDALVRVKWINEEQLSSTLHLHHGQVRKTLNKLKADKILDSKVWNEKKKDEKEKEKKDGFQPQYQQYQTHNPAHTYWTFPSNVLDIIRFRLLKLQQTLDERIERERESQMYICPHPQCRRVYSALDAQRFKDPITFMFLCEVCSSQLQPQDNTASLSSDQSLKERSRIQLQPIETTLRKLDNAHLPSFQPAADEINKGIKEQKAAAASAGAHSSSSSHGQTRQNYSHLYDASQEHEVVVDLSQIQPNFLPNNEAVSKPKTAKMAVPWLVSNLKHDQPSTPTAATPTTAQPAVNKELYEQYYKQYMEEQMLRAAVKPEPESHELSTDHAMQPKTEAEEEEEEAGAEEMVSVGGVLMPISDVTEEDHEKMSNEEYKIFHEKYQKLLQQY